MAFRNLLVDTSIFIDHLRKRDKTGSILYQIAPEYAFYTSTIVEFELFAGATNNQKEKDVQELISLCTVLPLNSSIAQKGAEVYHQLRQSNQLIEIRDILIASTALTHNLPLITLNKRHFARVETLEIITLP